MELIYLLLNTFLISDPAITAIYILLLVLVFGELKGFQIEASLISINPEFINALC